MSAVRQALEVEIGVNRDATLAPGRRQQAARLVEAKRVHRQLGGRRELLDAIIHALILGVITLKDNYK